MIVQPVVEPMDRFTALSWTLKYFKLLTDQIVEEVPGAAPVGDHQRRQDRGGPGHVGQLQAQAGLGLQETHVCTVYDLFGLRSLLSPKTIL